jgi:hypothetical protein
LDTEFIKVRFRACQIIRIMGFQSRELDIAFTERAVAWTCNINDSPVQSALECGYESRSPARLSKLSSDNYHTLVNEVGEKVQ